MCQHITDTTYWTDRRVAKKQSSEQAIAAREKSIVKKYHYRMQMSHHQISIRIAIFTYKGPTFADRMIVTVSRKTATVCVPRQ